MNTKKEVIVNHLKKVRLNDKQIEEILSTLSIEEAYENLQRNKILKKVVSIIGIDEVEKRAKDMGMTIDVFAKKFDRWNDVSSISIVSKASKQEQENLTNKMFDTIIKSIDKSERKEKK